MKYPAYWLLPTLALALASFGCGAVERQPEPEFPGGVPTTTAASAGANVEPSPETRPAEPRLRPNLHVFGLSYHPDRNGTRDSHLDNELNVGLGLNYEFHNDARGVANMEAGFYRDSGRNWATFAGVGYQFKLSSRLGLGADLLAVQSPTYNKGNGFVAPVPRLTYNFGAVKVNLVYVPKIQPWNLFAVFAVYFTVPFAPFGNW
jgi:hypothetical protein